MVDRAHRGLVEPRVLGLGEVRHVEDVRRRVPVGGLPGAVNFVQLVVKEQVGLVWGSDPALVRVAGADVGGLGDLDGVGLVGYVDDGERVFVVVEADFLALVFGVGAVVDDALR